MIQDNKVGKGLTVPGQYILLPFIRALNDDLRS